MRNRLHIYRVILNLSNIGRKSFFRSRLSGFCAYIAQPITHRDFALSTMSISYTVRHAVHPDEVRSYSTQQIRDAFLIDQVFVADHIQLVYTHYDRYIAGGAMPLSTPVRLETIPPLRSDYFLERREMGIINVGAPGSVMADGTAYSLGFGDALYLGRGVRDVAFNPSGEGTALYYINSAPAHATYPSRKVAFSEADTLEAGQAENANRRTIRKLLVNSVLPTCQLQMGFTELKTGSVWNTMPAHTHDRRMEVYFYFGLPEGQVVCHFMGQPAETRPLWLSNHQAVISPPWSIHCGAGTSSYSFIWGMAGENLDYGDMDGLLPADMR
jgi:4-deoxy-L-threo-5-hexosulose-uronate ketol-isomerase